MTDGSGNPDLPHLILPGAPRTEPFRRRSGGGGGPQTYPISNRGGHASGLRSALEQAIDDDQAARRHHVEELQADGIVLAVEGWPRGFKLALESLDLRRSGIELLSVREEPVEGAEEPEASSTREVAAVFVPDDKVDLFFKRLDQYATEDTDTGQPRHRKLVANIASLRRATLEQLWTDSRPIPEGVAWWELWLRRTDSELEILAALAEQHGWARAATVVEFPSRTVVAIRTDAETLAGTLSTSLPIAEARLASLAQSPAELDLSTQREWVADLVTRVSPSLAAAPAVCVLDTGLFQHSLFQGSITPGDILHVVGADGRDRHGHGTELAGLALLGDLTDHLTSGQTVQLEHRLEAVKILPDAGTNHPDTYGAVTASGVAAPEAANPSRTRVYCLANSDPDSRSDGRPTLWSATIDAIAFGTDVVSANGELELLSAPDPTASRLVCVSGGNVRSDFQAAYLDVCDTSAIEDPGQSWNALTVGAFTRLTTPPADPFFSGYTTLAETGDLSPFSRTSLPFSNRWPLKPDIVMEGGNLLVSPAVRTFDQHDVVSLLTTSHREPLGQPLTSINATSAATAQAARLAALASAYYPKLWPETVRGLLIHSAEWSEAMWASIRGATSKTARRQLVRRYGFGTPSLERVLRSAAGAVTMIAESRIHPFEEPENGRTRLREMHLHELPWPDEQLLELGDLPVRLRVTLSYFIEPNASSRGWRGRYVYPSHGLRFDIRRPGETTNEFRARLNTLAEDEERLGGRSTAPEPGWLLGPQSRNVGSVHSDMWLGTAAELADCGAVGIYPVGGWWKANNRGDRTRIPVRYSLLVSLVTPEVGIDLYTPIAARIGVPIEIET